MGNIITVDRISYTYGTNESQGNRRILSELSFGVAPGTILGIVGASGCGKSTLLKLTAGFLKPDSGSIYLDNERISTPGPDIILVFQEFDQLFPWLTVAGNLRFPLRRVAGLGHRETERPINEALRLTSMLPAAHHYPYQLSGGMKQRAAIARAMVLRPRVLLMDEPFGSLDFALRGELQQLIRRIAAETGVAILFVTHDIQEVITVADSVLVLAGDGSGHTLIDVPAEAKVPNSPASAGLAAEIVHAFRN